MTGFSALFFVPCFCDAVITRAATSKLHGSV